jgi:Fe-Mn family superoxide dismutase
MNHRRTFLAAGSVAATALAAAPFSAVIGAVPALDGRHELPELPYDYAALEPWIDAQTMQIHHSKHHAAYVAGLMKAEGEMAKAREAGDHALVQHWAKQAAFHGGGHWLHSMFWKVMAPPGKGGGGQPSATLEALLRKSFGSLDAFRKQFAAAAAAVEGSGWALMHYRQADDTLILLQAENQHKLTPWGATPVMGLDVWEHAYYLKYQNRRADYVTAWWNVVNWQQVENNVATLRR